MNIEENRDAPIEERKPRTLQEEQDMYSKEEKEKLAKYMAFFAKTGDKDSRAKAQNEKMKLLSENVMGPEKKKLTGAAYEFKRYKKFVVFDRNSCFCLYKGNKVRDLAVQLICWPMFDNFIVLMIFINSIFMMCYEYNDRNNEQPTN